jgi:hypothetical protein
VTHFHRFNRDRLLDLQRVSDSDVWNDVRALFSRQQRTDCSRHVFVFIPLKSDDRCNQFSPERLISEAFRDHRQFDDILRTFDIFVCHFTRAFDLHILSFDWRWDWDAEPSGVRCSSVLLQPPKIARHQSGLCRFGSWTDDNAGDGRGTHGEVRSTNDVAHRQRNVSDRLDWWELSRSYQVATTCAVEL